ncbi:MAG: hypothetical protein ACOYJD_07835 [Christensenellales bacterium]|jgi:hypothetical protein
MQGNDIKKAEATPFKTMVKGAGIDRSDFETGTKIYESERLPLYIRGRNNAPRPTALKRPRSEEDVEETKKLKSMVIKLAVCAAVCLAVLMFAKVDAPFARQVTDGVKTALTFEVNIDETLGKLKFVQEVFPDTATVMAPDDTYAWPVQGDIITVFGEDSKGIVFRSDTMGDVMSPASGTLSNVEIDEQITIEIDHGSGLISILKFSGAAATLGEGSELRKGGYVGLVDSGKTVYFEMQKDGVAVDPAAVLGLNAELTVEK